MFTFGGIIGTFVLLPVNYLGKQLSIDDFYDLPKKSLDSFSISNVDNGSNWSVLATKIKKLHYSIMHG